MKVSLALGPRKPLDRDQARACLVANICFPGTGSLLAGRRVGYAQAALYLFTLVLQMFFVGWYLKLLLVTREFPFPAEWGRLGYPRSAILWMALALSTVLMFAAAWLWALLTSFIIASEVKRGTGAPPPETRKPSTPPPIKAP